MERQRFEDSWKESFKDAEVSPSDSLWTNIELDLEKENGSKMKRRIMFFQLLAAASIAFAMTFAGIGLYFVMHSNDKHTQFANELNPLKRPESPVQTLSEANGKAPAASTDQINVRGENHSTTGAAPAADQRSSAEVARPDRNQAAAYGPNRPTSSDETLAKTGDYPTSSSDHDVASAPHETTADKNALASSRIASASDRQGSRAPRRAAGSHSISPASDRNTTIENLSASERMTSTTGQAASASKRADSDLSEPTAPVSMRVAAASGQTNSVAGRADANQVVGHGTTPAGQVASTPNQVASAGDQTTPAANGAIPGSSDPTAPASSRIVSTSGQTNGASQRVSADVTVQQPVIANPFTIIAATSPEERELSTTKGSLPPIARGAEPSLPIASRQPVSTEADPVALMLARLDDEEKKYAQDEKDKKKKDKGTERLWTSVGVAAGAYNMVTSGGSSAVAANNFDQAFARTSSTDLTQDVVRKQSSASGMAYSVGLNLGTKVAPRWVLQGGVNYLTQSSGYTSNAAVTSTDNAQQFSAKPASIEEFNNASTSGRASDTKVVPTAEYHVNSSVQYFSVPLQAGYLAVNRAFGLQFNAGVSTDLFIKNTLTPDGGSLQKSTQTRSDDTPYRPLNFSGLIGTEFSYRFGPHYRLALNPGVRYPFSSIYKSDIAVSAMPLTFDVGLKFRYIFH